MSTPLLVIAAYAAVGAALTVVASRRARPLVDVVVLARTSDTHAAPAVSGTTGVRGIYAVRR